MNINTVLVLIVMCLCIMYGLSSCALSDDKFHSREQVAKYIEKNFPGETYTLSDKARKIRGVTGATREWKFTLGNYPDYKFHVNSRCGWGMIPFDYAYTNISNDAYNIVAQDVLSEKKFYKGVLKKDYPELCEYWNQKGVKKIINHDSAGFKLDDGDLSPFVITIPDITKVDDAQKLAGVVVNYMHEKAPDLSEIPFCVRMLVEEKEIKLPLMRIDHDYRDFGRKVYLEESFAGRDWESIYNPDDDWGHYGHKTWKQNLIEGICKVSAYNGINVCGITDDQVQEWMQRVVVGGDDTYSNMDEWFTKKCIKTDDRYMLVGVLNDTIESHDNGVYLTLGVARNFYEWCGLKVEGDRTNYKVTGKDGSVYKFSYDYYDKRKDNSRYHYYIKNGNKYEWPKGRREKDSPMDDYTIKQVSGIDIHDLIIGN